jgi:small-conductance mechanosensitive channel
MVLWIRGVAVAAGVWLTAWLLGRVVVGRIARLLRRTSTEVDDLLLVAIRPQLPVWSAALGIVIGAHQIPLPEAMRQVVLRGAEALVIFSVTLAVSRLLGELLRLKSAQWPEVLPATTLTRNVIHIIVVGLGVLVIASNLGIAITPIITALGVGSLAVALALQPTLANLFAGFHVTLSRKIRVGDYVELEGGTQGYVEDVGWRSTQIRELPNNLIIVPNAKLAEIVVKNYTLPENEQAALVQVGVSYASDLEKVERVTLEVARQILGDTPGGVAEFEPLVRYHTFGDSSINFTVVLRVKQFVDRYLVTHEFIKRLRQRYEDEGIEIPFPQRVLHLAGHRPEADQLGL